MNWCRCISDRPGLQFFEQCLCRDEISSPQPLSEPVVDARQHLRGLLFSLLPVPQSSQADRRSQLQRLLRPAPGEIDRGSETFLSNVCCCFLHPQQQLTFYAMDLGCTKCVSVRRLQLRKHLQALFGMPGLET